MSVERRKAPWMAGARAWLRRHGYSLLSSIGALVRQPWINFMTIAVLAIALTLPLGLHTALTNLRVLTEDLERLDSISVFLDIGIDAEGARRIASRLATWPEVVAVDPVAPEQGMEQLAGLTGLGEFDDIDVPLPWLLDVAPGSEADVAGLAARIGALDGVDQVVVDLEWLRRLDALLAVFARLVSMLAVLFAAAVAFVIANNIRADIQAREEEIEVMALVGATPGWIRRPFLYSGLWMGLAGGLAAWGLVLLGLEVLSGPVAEVAQAYGSRVALVAPDAALAGGMVGLAGVLGVVGAHVAVTRHLGRLGI
ncbi:MAG: permease-like cell division protein FtsX [Wenzhouxiangellaceae bacterium]|nr:permease-like cell division protein FtsX [Wenzhouxiangellaceae bacterium]